MGLAVEMARTPATPPVSRLQQDLGNVTTVLDRHKKSVREFVDVTEHADVEAPNKAGLRSAYAPRRKIYPKLAHGAYRRIKWLVMAATLAIYYALPWVRWDRGGDLPDQAVLLDMAHNRYFVFFLEIWPQEFYYITGLLILAALGLFFVTAVAGRVWCGYACPQTVWTDLMVTVERFWQGDRSARIRLDAEPWGLRKIALKGLTHLSWLAIGLATGGALVFYFADAPTLARQLVTGAAPPVAYLFLGIFTLTTYLLGGIAREQVCIYMCPWPRIQGAMTDRHTLLVSYRTERGEPRGPYKKGQPWEGRGDCIDCNACISVCPTGIDIRDGAQLECIQCALCIDACNDIMDRVARPRGLIAYDTVASTEAAVPGGPAGFVHHAPLKLVRPRTLLYAGLFVTVGLVMLAAWSHRSVIEVNVLPDRSPPFVRLTGGGVRNGYTLKILNKQYQSHTFTVAVGGLPQAQIAIVGEDAVSIRVPADELREFRIFVTSPSSEATRSAAAIVPVTFSIRDMQSGATAIRTSRFQTGQLPETDR